MHQDTREIADRSAAPAPRPSTEAALVHARDHVIRAKELIAEAMSGARCQGLLRRDIGLLDTAVDAMRVAVRCVDRWRERQNGKDRP